MKNKLIKTFLIIATFFFIENVNGQAGYNQGHEVKASQMVSAYNSPARIDIRGRWDIFTYGSFIWWNASQEDMELAISNDSDTLGLPIVNGKVINMKFKYKPGFKAGLGISTNHDDWDAVAEYTWFHFTQRQSSGRPQNGILHPTWSHPDNLPEALSTQGKWRAHLDIVNAELARSYYVGTHLIFRTHFGARLALIDQKFTVAYVPRSNAALTVKTRNTSNSWGLGPRAGLGGNWILGVGFRIFGNVATDLLYTRYRLTIKEDSATNPSTLVININDKIKYLRPHNEFQMGIGWGTYFDNNNFHVDFAASYDFHIFWNQNMFRQFYDDVSEGISAATLGNLCLHGATLTLRLDF